MQKQMLGILARLDGIAVRESVLATVGTRRVKRSFDPFGEALYEITGAGKDALMGR